MQPSSEYPFLRCKLYFYLESVVLKWGYVVRQRFSLQHRWNAYKGTDSDGDGSQIIQPYVFSMRKQSTFGYFKFQNEADIFMGRAELPDFRIEGSFRRRTWRITRFGDGEVIARISTKKVGNMILSDEVFSLVVVPGFSRQLAMAFVIVLDRICGNKYMPSLCCGTWWIL